MLRLSSKITIEGSNTWEFTAISSCSIVEDTENLTDTCTIALPKKIKWAGAVGGGANPPVKRGDKITVQMGYNDTLKTRFVGYVRRVSIGVPVKLECEDGMFMLKLAEVKKKGYKSVTLDQLVADILTGTGIKHTLIDKNIVLGPYRITRNTVAEELSELKREFGLMAYFRTVSDEAILYVGFTYPFDGRRTERFVFSKNIVAEELEYRRKEDIKMKVKATSIQAKSSQRITVEVGDKDGELRTVYHYNLKRDELKVFAQSELERFKYTGYQGSFTGFGEPMVNKTDIADVTGSDGNRGKYLIKKVETTFGMDGYRQKIELGKILG